MAAITAPAAKTLYSIPATRRRRYVLFSCIPGGRGAGSAAEFLRSAKRPRQPQDFRRLEMGATLTGVPLYLARGYVEGSVARCRWTRPVVAHSPYGKTVYDEIFVVQQRRLVLRLLVLCSARAASTLSHALRSVPLCSGITLSASYLARSRPTRSRAFVSFCLNRTSREIKLAEPVPSSSHWYARARGPLVWRASNGAGGSLVDAGNEHGRVMVYPPESARGRPDC